MTKQESYLQHIARAEEQGLSLSAYARQHQLSAKCLYAARYTAKQRLSLSSDFVPVTVAVTTSSFALRAVLPNGVELYFLDASPETLSRLAELSCSR